MPEQLPNQKPLPEELLQSRPQGEAIQGFQARTLATSEFAVDAGQAFVDRVARLTLPADEWAQEKAKNMIGHTINASKVALGGMQRAISFARVKASTAWTETRGFIGDKWTVAKSLPGAAKDGLIELGVTTKEKVDDKLERRKQFNEFLGAVALDHAIGNRISPITVTENKDQYAFDPADKKIKKVGEKPHQFSDEVVSEVDPGILGVKIESKSEKRRAKRMGRRLARAEKADKKEAEATRLRGGLPSKGSRISVPLTRLAKLGGAKGVDAVRYREGWNRATARSARAGIAAKPRRIATRRLPEYDVEHFIRTHS